MDLINEPWPWYVAGPLIGLFIPLLLILGNKSFGISSSFRHICAACIPVKDIEFFKYNWKEYKWNLFLVVGVFVGALVVGLVLDLDYEIAINPKTKEALSAYGITSFSGLIPNEIFGWENFSIKSLALLLGGGFLVGFGTRYANGCTSGHAIMGLSLLSVGSLVAVIGFFIGGLIMTHLLLPIIL